MQEITTFLMFEGNAEEAMSFYTTVFDDAQITSIFRYGANEEGVEGTVKQATFSIHGKEFMCFDSSEQRISTKKWETTWHRLRIHS